MNPLDRLTEVISRLMGKEPSDPDVLKYVVEVVMAMRAPSDEMVEEGAETVLEGRITEDSSISIALSVWENMIDALLTEGEG